MSPGRSTTSDPQSVRVTRGGDEVSRGIRETRVKGGGRTRGKRVGISPPQLYVTPAALAFWLYTSPPYMMLHADEFQRFESRVGARTMWWLPPPQDRFRRRKKKCQNLFFVANFGTRHSRRARGDARAGWRRIKLRLSPGRRPRSPDTILGGSGYARAPLLVFPSRSLASLPRELTSECRSSLLFDAGCGEWGVGSTGGRVAGRV